MKKKQSENRIQQYAIALVALILLISVIWFLDSINRPQPLSSGAADFCDVETLVNNKGAGYAVKAGLPNQDDGSVVVDAALRNNTEQGFDPFCEYENNYEFLFLYQPANAVSTFIPHSVRVPVEIRKENGVINQLVGFDRQNAETAISPNFTGSEYNVKVYLVAANNPNPSLGRNNLIGQTTVENVNAPTGDIDTGDDGSGGDDTGDIDLGTGNNAAGGGGSTGNIDLGNSASGGTKARGANSGACNSQYFTYDSKTGLCLPKSGSGKNTNVYDLIAKIIKILLGLAGAVAVVFVIIGGYFYITSAGNEEQATRGRRTITYALIGTGAVILSYAAVSVVTSFINSNVG